MKLNYFTILVAIIFLIMPSCSKESNYSSTDADLELLLEETFADLPGLLTTMFTELKNNENLASVYERGGTEHELQLALMEDLGLPRKTSSYPIFDRHYTNLRNEYIHNSIASGYNINNPEQLELRLIKDLGYKVTNSKSCRGTCRGEYAFRGVACVAMVTLPVAGIPLSLACVASSAYIFHHCLDDCQPANE